MDKERLKRAVPWQAAVIGALLSLAVALVFAYVRDWWGVVFVIVADIALISQSYYYEARTERPERVG